MANKITKREVINSMLANVLIQENATWVAYLENELALLDKKSSSKRETATQKANVGIKDTILATLAQIGSGSVSAIQSANADLKEFSNQKITALLTQLSKEGKVVKTTEKKVAVFSLAEGGDVAED